MWGWFLHRDALCKFVWVDRNQVRSAHTATPGGTKVLLPSMSAFTTALRVALIVDSFVGARTRLIAHCRTNKVHCGCTHDAACAFCCCLAAVMHMHAAMLPTECWCAVPTDSAELDNIRQTREDERAYLFFSGMEGRKKQWDSLNFSEIDAYEFQRR